MFIPEVLEQDKILEHQKFLYFSIETSINVFKYLERNK